jgi:hypothetical protein
MHVRSFEDMVCLFGADPCFNAKLNKAPHSAIKSYLTYHVTKTAIFARTDMVCLFSIDHRNNIKLYKVSDSSI